MSTKKQNVTEQAMVRQEEPRRFDKAPTSTRKQLIVVEASQPVEKLNLGGSGGTISRNLREGPTSGLFLYWLVWWSVVTPRWRGDIYSNNSGQQAGSCLGESYRHFFRR